MTAYQPTGWKQLYHTLRRQLAAIWLKLCRPTQIAVTGSQGKTNTTQLIARLLTNFGSTVATDINLDTLYNVPITALRVRPWTKYVVWELGIDRPKEMGYHLQLARPLIGIITGISPVHTDKEHLGSLKKLVAEKRKLIEALPEQGRAILNYDDDNVREMADYTQAPVWFFGSNRRNCQVTFNDVKLSLKGTRFTLTDRNQQFYLFTPLIGKHHVYTFMAGYLVVKHLFGIQPKTIKLIKDTASQIQPLQGRMSVEPGPLKTILLNDSLRANPESTRAGLETLSLIDYSAGRKIAVLGVMGELENPQLEHKKTADQLIQYPPDYVICLGDHRKITYDNALYLGFPRDRLFFVQNVVSAADILKKIIKPNDLIYLKVSFLRNLKRIIQILNNQPICCQADLCPYDHCGYNTYLPTLRVRS